MAGLTMEERVVVVAALEKYPKGVPSGAWGYGPMAEKIDDGHPGLCFRHANEYGEETLAEYG